MLTCSRRALACATCTHRSRPSRLPTIARFQSRTSRLLRRAARGLTACYSLASVGAAACRALHREQRLCMWHLFCLGGLSMRAREWQASGPVRGAGARRNVLTHRRRRRAAARSLSPQSRACAAPRAPGAPRTPGAQRAAPARSGAAIRIWWSKIHSRTKSMPAKRQRNLMRYVRRNKSWLWNGPNGVLTREHRMRRRAREHATSRAGCACAAHGGARRPWAAPPATAAFQTHPRGGGIDSAHSELGARWATTRVLARIVGPSTHWQRGRPRARG